MSLLKCGKFFFLREYLSVMIYHSIFYLRLCQILMSDILTKSQNSISYTRNLSITYDVGYLSVIMTNGGNSLLNFADNVSLSNCKLVNMSKTYQIVKYDTIKKKHNTEIW